MTWRWSRVRDGLWHLAGERCAPLDAPEHYSAEGKAVEEWHE